MVLIFIFIIIIVIGFILWQRRNKKIAQINRISQERGHKEYLKAEEKRKLRVEERISEQDQARKRRAEMDVADLRASEERKLREEELRRKIEDAKKQKANEEKRRIEENQ